MISATGAGSPVLGGDQSSVSCPLPTAQCFASYNWGGYAVYNNAFLVSAVSGSWTVPYIVGSNPTSCPDAQSTWDDNSVWIGIDGFNDSTVEQTGTSSDCFYGQTAYYAWYEFYPAASVSLPYTVNPGDQMTASVSYVGTSGGQPTFQTTISDFTQHWSYTSPVTAVPGALRTSAEWIDESAYYYGFLGLTRTVQIPFIGASATIDGVTHSLAGWGSNVDWLVMVDYNFPYDPVQQYVKGEPGAISFLGTGFEVTWYTYGP